MGDHVSGGKSVTGFQSTYRVALKSSSNRSKAGFMRILITALVVLAAFMGGYVYWWNLIADEAVIGFERWKSAQAAQGITINHDSVSVEGFPYRVHLSTSSLEMTQKATTHAAQRRMSVPKIWAIAQPWQLSHIIVGSEGTLEYEEKENDTVLRSLFLTPEKAMASITVSNSGALETLAVDLMSIQFEGTMTGPGSATRLQLHTRSEEQQVNLEGSDAKAENLTPAPLQQVAVRVDTLTLERLKNNPLGSTIDKAELLLESAASFRDFKDQDAILKWRDNGGALDVSDAKLNWGPSALKGSGSVTLDQENYPLGAFTLQVTGFAELFEQVARSKNMNDQNIRSAIFALNMLAKSGEDGQRYVQLPFSLQDRSAYIGPLKLFKLEPVF
jgi:hypothetical protein